MYIESNNIFLLRQRACVVPYIYRSNTTFSSGEILEFMDSESPVVARRSALATIFFPARRSRCVPASKQADPTRVVGLNIKSQQINIKRSAPLPFAVRDIKVINTGMDIQSVSPSRALFVHIRHFLNVLKKLSHERCGRSYHQQSPTVINFCISVLIGSVYTRGKKL